MTPIKKKNVLLYYWPNKRSVVIETITEEVKKAGHNFIVLTLSPRGDIHEEWDKSGIENYAIVYKRNFLPGYYLKHLFYLIRFCRRHKIDTLWSHLQQCSIIAVFAQYFIKARTVIFRHHFHAIIKQKGLREVNRNERVFENIICGLAKEIVVPSYEVYNGMIKYEKRPERKISIIPYIYDFSKYNAPDKAFIEGLKKEYPARLRIIVASRMIKMKRHMLVLPIFNKLIKEGLDIKVFLMDEGEERPVLEQYVKDNGLDKHIFFFGYQVNIIDYLSAGDLLVHPSFTEASSSMVKEFALLKKPVIACKGVGDFDQYIIDGENGFLVGETDEAASFEKYIRFIYNNPSEARQMGQSLHEKVLDIFSANEKSVGLYLSKI
jgi:glycosyltransferase involved in cell wall biosynthesis